MGDGIFQGLTVIEDDKTSWAAGATSNFLSTWRKAEEFIVLDAHSVK